MKLCFYPLIPVSHASLTSRRAPTSNLRSRQKQTSTEKLTRTVSILVPAILITTLYCQLFWGLPRALLLQLAPSLLDVSLNEKGELEKCTLQITRSCRTVSSHVSCFQYAKNHCSKFWQSQLTFRGCSLVVDVNVETLPGAKRQRSE